MGAITMPAATAQISYDDLYARWEKGNWSATTIDFSQDRIDWEERMTPEQRAGALWLFTLFFHGEDSVADNLSPYIDAAPLEEQKYFLATQQVDEARHAIFFKRFMTEVAGRGGDGTIGGSLRATAPELSWGHIKTFGYLDRVADRLRTDRSPVNLARSVAMYHLIVEGFLAQPTQHALEESMTSLGLLPGFLEGMRNVSLDEQRHIAFGVRLLADLHQDDPIGIRDAIIETFRISTPWTTAVGLPPNRDFDFLEPLGIDLDDLFEEGARLNEQRLKAVGLDITDLPRYPLAMELPPRQRSQKGKQLLLAGMLGPKSGPASREPEAVAAMFDSLRRTANSSAAKAGTTIQWDFPDADPWFIRLDNGSTSAQAGRADRPDLTLRVSFDDWVDVFAGRENARKLMLRRRIRPKGSMRVLAKMGSIFG